MCFAEVTGPPVSIHDVQIGLHKQQPTGINPQQVEMYSSQTAVPLNGPRQAPAQLWQSTQVLPAPVAYEASQPAGCPVQHCAMPQDSVCANILPYMAHQAPQHLQYRMASLQQQILPKYPPQQQIICPEPQSGFTDRQDSLASRTAAHYHASLKQAPKASQALVAHGIVVESGQAKSATEGIRNPEQQILHPCAPSGPPPNATAEAARAAEQPADFGSQAAVYPSVGGAVSAAQTAALATPAVETPAVEAAAGSERPLERYMDLHAALERGTGSVQSFSAMEAVMFCMADLKQACASFSCMLCALNLARLHTHLSQCRARSERCPFMRDYGKSCA